jgi:hypothetical protein
MNPSFTPNGSIVCVADEVVDPVEPSECLDVICPECPPAKVCLVEPALMWSEDLDTSDGLNWYRALRLCGKMDADGRQNWRLPLIEELMDLDLDGVYVSGTQINGYRVYTYDYDTRTIGYAFGQGTFTKSKKYRCVSDGRL